MKQRPRANVGRTLGRREDVQSLMDKAYQQFKFDELKIRREEKRPIRKKLKKRLTGHTKV